MKTVATTIGQTVILLAVGLAIALGANTVRPKNHIDLGRDYNLKTKPDEPNQPNEPDEPNKALLSHPYNELTFAQVSELFNSGDTSVGLNLFVDARNDELYEEGHIPGAIQCDFYRLDRYLDNVIGRAAGASRIIVYCTGGRCEDSLLVCQELVRSGIPKELIYLFRGGWEEWTKNQMPVVTGRE